MDKRSEVAKRLKEVRDFELEIAGNKVFLEVMYEMVEDKWVKVYSFKDANFFFCDVRIFKEVCDELGFSYKAHEEIKERNAILKLMFMAKPIVKKGFLVKF